ncbi:MAG: hypothetical protein WCJ66_10020 [Verrucomicrobiota bacterium]
MKTNSDPSDPIREMLTDDAAHLPAMAAQAAREFRSRHRYRLAQAAVVALLGVCCWQTFPLIRSAPKGGDLPQNVIQQSAFARPRNFVMVQTIDEAISRPLSSPSGATQEQKDILESARELPLLVVMDGSGKPTQILVLER